MIRVEEPNDGNELAVTVGWLRFHRDALAAKCARLSPGDLTSAPCSPSKLSLLGLVRHLTEMERVYGVWALGPKTDLDMVYGQYTDDGPEWEFDVDESMVAESFERWEREQRATDGRVASFESFDTPGPATGRSVRWSLQKLVGEYARHNGHAAYVPQVV